MTYELPGYDAWLERPYQERYAAEPPGEVEDLLELEFWLDGERAVIDSYETWEDADEDGRYGGVDLIVRIGGTRVDGPIGYWTGGRERTMSPTEVEEVLASQDEHRGDQ